MKVTYTWLEELVPALSKHLRKYPRSEEDLSFGSKRFDIVAELLTMAGLEVETTQQLLDGDVLYDVNVTPNRGDCLSVLGIARELSALTSSSLAKPAAAVEEADWDTASRIEVRVDEGALCPRYAARVIEGVTIGESPAWLREKLEAVGIRPINNVVDVTNHVLLELGQPLHAFDLDKLFAPNIIVRRAQSGEEIVTIDGQKRSLPEGTLVIADESGPVAVAGVMGGHDTEVSENTRRILLECAYFDPGCVRRTSKKLNLATESSYRFERGVDVEAIPLAIDRAAQLIADTTGGTVGRKRIDVAAKRPERPTISLRLDTLQQVLGRVYRREEVLDILERLLFSVEEVDNSFIVKTPSFRSDIQQEVDLVEEVARLSGYDSIPSTMPEITMHGTGRTSRMLLADKLRGLLTGLGLDEVISYSFLSVDDLDKLRTPGDNPHRDTIEIANPVSREYSHMRTTMIPGLLKILSTNSKRGTGEVAIFEVGRVYPPGDRERASIGIALMGKQWSLREPLDFYTMKGIILSLLEALDMESYRPEKHLGPMYHPGQSASISTEGRPIATFGRIHPRVARNYNIDAPVFVAEIDLSTLESRPSPVRSYTPLPRYPSVRRDIAMIVDEDLPFGTIEDLLKGSGCDIIKEVKLFDLYHGRQVPPGKKSLAVSVIYRSDHSTLTDKEVNEAHRLLCEKFVEELGCTIR